MKEEGIVTLILKEGVEHTGRKWPEVGVKPALPRVTSQGELIGCWGPGAPPSLSVPCTPMPATVETLRTKRSIWKGNKNLQIWLRTDINGNMRGFVYLKHQSQWIWVESCQQEFWLDLISLIYLSNKVILRVSHVDRVSLYEHPLWRTELGFRQISISPSTWET